MPEPRLSELIEAALAADSIEALHSVCSRAAALYGYDHFIYGARFPSSLTRPFMLVISGHPDEWRERYQAEDYIQLDPAVRHSVNHVRPARWSELFDSPEYGPEDLAVLHEAAAFGLVTGTCLPVRGSRGEVGLLSFSSGRRGTPVERDIRASQPALFMFSSYVHEAVCGLLDHGALPYRPASLTARERECLLWAAEGKTAWETGAILGVSERTVVFHLNNAARKLDVTSRQQAVARAIAQGLIAPQLA
ncbi:Transcriptional activator protein AnoR [wastewater metagenome]|uniref:Transcriptional activator protein AnoR n=2 Tax=unclassified sequences TaxID=12908 RepID=A0A5B8RG96_9ZZZZ|nr:MULTISPECIES: LuxR family transcriptional regulator [Arhodomonas]QEA06524.1 transcriptional activator protein AnoR [uncultured organism]